MICAPGRFAGRRPAFFIPAAARLLCALAALAGAICLAHICLAHAQPLIPDHWDERERLARPDLSGMERLRFLTTLDFPPFSFLDADGRLVGFHVDLARAICQELGLAERCQIQALPWDELDAAMQEGDGEALIAGLAVTEASRERYAFSRAYLHFPARFVAARESAMAEPMHEAVAGRRVGVLAGSAHEAMLRDYFPAALPQIYWRPEWLHRSLREGRIDAAFGDGMRLSFWLAGADSQECCRFAGGPYLAPEYLGNGLAVAVRGEEAELAAAFDFALREIAVKGRFAELYLRHFPIGFY